MGIVGCLPPSVDLTILYCLAGARPATAHHVIDCQESLHSLRITCPWLKHHVTANPSLLQYCGRRLEPLPFGDIWGLNPAQGLMMTRVHVQCTCIPPNKHTHSPTCHYNTNALSINRVTRTPPPPSAPLVGAQSSPRFDDDTCTCAMYMYTSK